MGSTTSQTPPRPASGTGDWQRYGEHRGRVLHRERVAHHVNLYIVEKPEGFDFRPGQAVELAIDEQGWRERKRPFTLTSLPSNPRLEFIVKTYPTDENPEHDGVTEHLGRDIVVGDRLIFSDAWGAIEYNGPGTFIAGGAGITPFIAILRQLEQRKELAGNRLFFSNRRAEDVILQGELFRMLGTQVVCTLTQERHRDYEHGRIDAEWLRNRIDDFAQPFYLCGPPGMVKSLRRQLADLGADPQSLVFEEGG
ncbi:flavodoxin reductase [Roseiconus nitratireducens]|uniref:Flavodoxin reductase n=1 Tax=Roseiconus nitratireducens TaxID=2605748 RepID=A0A5M6DBW7_9BACT|nr:flavodoxin reductase [Roseiconus nitratireducens]KAA5542645.1 flavodoxin reductase [Roseiconus nitratireducens]